MRGADAAAIRTALLLGAAGGMRTLAPWSAMALRGRVFGGPGRLLPLGAAAGEMIADKHPAMPSRTEARGIVLRLLSTSSAGFAIGGAGTALPAAAVAFGSAHAATRLRAVAGRRTRLPDPLLGAVEDALAHALAWLATEPERAG